MMKPKQDFCPQPSNESPLFHVFNDCVKELRSFLTRRLGCADGRVWFADRPGNRRADSFRNILAQPRIATAMLIPGCTRVGILSGTARLTTNAAMRADFAVFGKTPLLTTCIEQPTPVVSESRALAQARLWPAAPPIEGLNPAEMFATHVKLSKARGLQAKLMRVAVAVPGLMKKGLQRDYRDNLY